MYKRQEKLISEASGERSEMPEELTSEVQKKQSESVKTEETSEEKTRTEKIPEIPEDQSEQ